MDDPEAETEEQEVKAEKAEAETEKAEVETEEPEVDKPTPDLRAAPVLQEVVDADIYRTKCMFQDAVVMKVADTNVTVITDWDSMTVRSLYKSGDEACWSVLKVACKPKCITVLGDGRVAVSLPMSRTLITVAVTPNLKLLTTVHTGFQCWGLDRLDEDTLVVSVTDPSSVGLMDMSGTFLERFTHLPGVGVFKNAMNVHVTRRGAILVSDAGLKCVVCLTRTGDVVFTYAPTGSRALICPGGVTSTATGDILVVDHWAHKVLHLTESGQFVRDVLISEDGVELPCGICVEGDHVCVVMETKGLHKYRFAKKQREGK